MQYHNRQRKFFYFSPKRLAMKQLLLSTVIEGHLISCRARGLSPHTIIDYQNTFRKFSAHVGNVSFRSIEPAQVNAFLAGQRVSNKTKLNYHIGLSALWTYAVREGFAGENIMRKVPRPKPKIVAIQPFTEVEIRALLQAIVTNPERNRAMILLMLDTGARVSEICGLRRPEIDLIKRQIKVWGKGNKERFLPFSARTGSALYTLLSVSEAERPFLEHRTSLTQYLRRLGRRAGVPKVHPHRFRHTAAISMLRNGMDIYTLQEILGHSTLEMVKRYLSIAQVDIDTAHRRASPVENMRL